MTTSARIKWFLPALVGLTALAAGSVGTWGYRTLVEEQRLVELDGRVGAEARQFELAFRELRNDVILLAALPQVLELAGRREPEAHLADRVAGYFTTMLGAKPDYTQIRILDGEGMEVVRVDRRGDSAARTSVDALQAKGHRPYFQEAVALPPGRTYFSRVTLNRENGVVEVPHHPMLRAAVPLYVDGVTQGVLVINLDFASFLARLLPSRDGGFDFYLANEDGDYLYHPIKSRTYGFDLGKRHLVQEEFPEIVRTLDTAGGPAGAGRLIQFRRVHPFSDDPERFLLFGVASASDAIAVTTARVGTRVGILTAAVLGIAFVLTFALARRVTEPLEQLTAAAGRIAEDRGGEFHTGESDDEIEVLGRALDHMVASLQKKTDELEDAVTDLEYFARIASHDLREPARRMAALANLIRSEEGHRLSRQGVEDLARMRDEGAKLVEQLTDLRAFARIGRAGLRREPTDLGALVRRVLDDLSEDVSRRNVDVVVEPLPALPVYGNLVELLYQNLVRNALDHTAEQEFALAFTHRLESGEAVFSVSNTGSTISGTPDKLFEPFYGSGDEADHSGLGLSICRRIVARHSGRIWAESAGGLIHFRFTLEGTTGA